MIKGFMYFRLGSLDPNRTCKFYQAIGGQAREITENENRNKEYHIKLSENGIIAVHQVKEQPAGSDGWDHIALQVDDCARACKEIEAAGGQIEKYPTDNKLGRIPIYNAVAYGVDGEKIEIIQIK